MLNETKTPLAYKSGGYTSNSAAFFMAPQFLSQTPHNFYHYETSPHIAQLPT